MEKGTELWSGASEEMAVPRAAGDRQPNRRKRITGG